MEMFGLEEGKEIPGSLENGVRERERKKRRGEREDCLLFHRFSFSRSYIFSPLSPPCL